MIETGGGQFRTSTGRCVTNSVTRAIFATDRGQECIRTGRCGAMKRITGNLGLIDKAGWQEVCIDTLFMLAMNMHCVLIC